MRAREVVRIGVVNCLTPVSTKTNLVYWTVSSIGTREPRQNAQLLCEGSMDRRQLLAALVAGGTGGLVGCSFFSRSRVQDTVTQMETSSGTGAALPRGSPPSETAAATEVGERQSLGHRGTPGDICEREAKVAVGIYAITEPAFDNDWNGRTIDASYRLQGYKKLAPEQTVIGLEGVNTAKTYPITVLWEHEVVNDLLESKNHNFIF